MRWTRTANAGGLLETDDGRRILLDGVCRALNGYEGTPPALLERLLETKLDLIAFTHSHPDHFLAPFIQDYLRRWPGTVVAGPADVARAAAPYPVTEKIVDLGGIRFFSVPTRHIGATARHTPHLSFVLQTGSTCLWFTGDAAPVQSPPLPPLPRADVLLAQAGRGSGCAVACGTGRAPAAPNSQASDPRFGGDPVPVARRREGAETVPLPLRRFFLRFPCQHAYFPCCIFVQYCILKIIYFWWYDVYNK